MSWARSSGVPSLRRAGTRWGARAPSADWQKRVTVRSTACDRVLRLISWDDTNVVFARTVRLLKHWNGTHSKPMCSWNIKALCLGCLDEPMPLINALQIFFTYAADEIDKGPTPDPADGAGPIPLNMPRVDVHKRLRTARKYIDLAIEHEMAGRPLSAQHALHQVLPELVPDADGTQEEADRLARTVRSGGTAATGLGLATGPVTPTRAWGD